MAKIGNDKISISSAVAKEWMVGWVRNNLDFAAVTAAFVPVTTHRAIQKTGLQANAANEDGWEA